eukprot:gene12411-8517_t
MQLSAYRSLTYSVHIICCVYFLLYRVHRMTHVVQRDRMALFFLIPRHYALCH